MTGWEAPGNRRPGPLGPGSPQPEVLAVAALLVVAGLCLFIPALRDVPDRVSLVSDVQARYVPALLVSTIVSLLVGAVCFGIAFALYTGDRAAAALALGYGAALALALLFGYGRRGAELLALLLLVLAVAVLVLAPGTKPLLPWSAAGQGAGGEPRSVRAAWFLAGGLAVVAGAIGLVSIVAFSDANLAGGTGVLTGLLLCVFGALGLGALQPMKAGSINGRLGLTVAMGGVIASILIDHVISDVPVWAAVPLLLMGLAAVVIVLLWLPPDSKRHFVDSGLPYFQLGSMSIPGPGTTGRATPASRPPPPPPPTRSNYPPPVSSAGAYPPPPPPSSPPPQAPPAADPAWSAFDDAFAFPEPTPHPPAPRVFHEVVGVAPGATTARSAVLDLVYDQQTWFAVPAPGEQVHGALLVSMLMFDDTPGSAQVFQGTSTLIVTDRRLAGVCPKGTSPFGALDAANGPVVLWSVPVGSLERVELGSSSSGPHLSIGQVGGRPSWLLLGRPRVADSGSFRATDMDELAGLVRRAVP